MRSRRPRRWRPAMRSRQHSGNRAPDSCMSASTPPIPRSAMAISPRSRAKIVTASRAAGLEAPLDTVWVDLQNPEGLEASTRAALAYGFRGKMCIHPNQVEIVNRVFTPSEDEVAFAERVVAAFEKAEAE